MSEWILLLISVSQISNVHFKTKEGCLAAEAKIEVDNKDVMWARDYVKHYCVEDKNDPPRQRTGAEKVFLAIGMVLIARAHLSASSRPCRSRLRRANEF